MDLGVGAGEAPPLAAGRKRLRMPFEGRQLSRWCAAAALPRRARTRGGLSNRHLGGVPPHGGGVLRRESHCVILAVPIALTTALGRRVSVIALRSRRSGAIRGRARRSVPRAAGC